MRETGVVRKDITGDAEAAAPYIGIARTLLGKLKSRMRAGGLLSLSHSQELPDGTVISVVSRMGQDTVRIFTPVRSGSTSGFGSESPSIILPPTPRVHAPGTSYTVPGVMTLAGLCADGPPDFSSHLAMWRSRHQVLDPGYPPDANAANDGIAYTSNGGCTGISDDGSVLVGSATLAVARAATGFRWSKSGGFELLGGFGSVPDTYVFGCSGDGDTIAAASQNQDSPNGYLPCVWTRAAGLKFLPAAGSLFGYAWAVSNSGAYLCGQLYLSYNGQYTTGVARWHNGALTIISVGINNEVGYAVADNGMVVGARSGGTTGAYGACYWTPQGQMVPLLPVSAETSTALGVTPDGSVIVGVTGGAFAPGIFAKGGCPQSGAQAWYWTKAKGVTYLGPGVATAVSRDGSVIGGSTGAAGVSPPAIWSRTGEVTPLPMVGASVLGYVAAIGTTQPQTYTVGN